MRVDFYDTRLTDGGRVTLVKERGVNYGDCDSRFRHPEEVVRMACQLLHLDDMAEEHMYMLALNAASRLTGLFLVSKGGVCAAPVSPRELYIRALLSGAVQIILIHNHPSGSVCPGETDIRTTQNIKAAGELIGIPLTDHIIIGGGSGGYTSFREAGLL